MPTLRLSPEAVISGDDRPNTLDIIGNETVSRVYLWDIGPEKPMPPKKPTPRKGNDGDPEYELAKVEFAEELEDYRVALQQVKKQREEYAIWKERIGGPMEHPFDSQTAREALENDARAVAEGRQSQRRWYLSSRTRGSNNLINRGLPNGLQPGRGQADLERRAAEGEADLFAARRADPVFGQPELRG